MHSPTFVSVRRWLAVFILGLTAVSSGSAATAYTKVVVFGDSLSDSGNLAELTGGLFPGAPLYAEGRLSNGPVWVEYLAARLGLSSQLANYAVAGAMTKAAAEVPSGNIYSADFPHVDLSGTDVTSQVLSYLAEHGGQADPAALYIVQGGSNDLPRLNNPAEIVSNLVALVVALQQAGAKHILLVTLPDLGQTPRVLLGELSGQLPPGTSAFASALTAQLNQALVAAATAVTLPGVTLTIADMYAFSGDVRSDPAAYGITVTDLPYLAFGAGADPATWLFWDDLHPTTRGHELFAEAAIRSLVGAYSPRQGRGDGPGVINSLRGLARKAGGKP